MENIPKDLRQLRACKLCSMIKSYDQFLHNGCSNCEQHLRLKNDREAVQSCTSSNFDGMVCLMSPAESWVGRWQRIDGFVRGAYAVSVSGELPQDVLDILQNKGITYRSRNTAHSSS